VLVERCAAITSFKADDASMVREQRVDPPPTMRIVSAIPNVAGNAKYMVF
jgi:hypothetical protein